MVVGSALLALAACATPGGSPRDERRNPHYKIGSPYEVNGRKYHPRQQPDYEAIGIASWYGAEFNGRKTANGEIFDKDRLSAAHTTLPLPSVVEVENLENGRRAVLRVNDRGPFVNDRLIDLSHAAARELGFDRQGLARVKVRYLGRADLYALAPRRGRDAPEPKAASPARYAAASATPTPPRAPGPSAAPPATPSAKTAAAAAATPDVVAQLIDHAAIAPIPDEYWIDVKRIVDINRIESEIGAAASLGPSRVISSPGATSTMEFVLQLGPFPNADAANARLAALREAGYADAGLSSDPT